MPKLEKKDMLRIFPKHITAEGIKEQFPPLEEMNKLFSKSGLEGLDNIGYHISFLGLQFEDRHLVLFASLLRDIYQRIQAIFSYGVKETEDEYKKMVMDTCNTFAEYQSLLNELVKVELEKEKTEDLEKMLESLFDKLNNLAVPAYKLWLKAEKSEPLRE